MMPSRNSIARDQRGTSVIELGIIAPMFATLLIGMVDVSRAYTHRLQLEQAAQRTIEEVMQSPEMLTDYEDALKEEGAAAADVAEAAVVPDFWLECDGARQSSFTGACPAGTTSYARYVNVSITKPFDPTFASDLFPGANANGTYDVTGEAGIRVQ